MLFTVTKKNEKANKPKQTRNKQIYCNLLLPSVYDFNPNNVEVTIEKQLKILIYLTLIHILLLELIKAKLIIKNILHGHFHFHSHNIGVIFTSLEVICYRYVITHAHEYRKQFQNYKKTFVEKEITNRKKDIKNESC